MCTSAYAICSQSTAVVKFAHRFKKTHKYHILTMIAGVKIRKAVREDMDDVIDMIQELADFEKMPHGPQLTATDLIRDGGFNSDTAHPLFVCFVAEVESKDNSLRGEVIGFALSYFKSYTIPGSRVLYMEDLYVRSSHRNKGVGTKLFDIVELFARESGCCRLEFQVLRWNPATTLYKRMQAVDLTESDGWHQYRLTGDALTTLAK